MRKWIVKYEDHSGDVHIREVFAFSKWHAISKVGSWKTIYWAQELQPTKAIKL